MLGFKRRSGWRWKTSAGDSAGASVYGPISVSLSGGHLIVTSPTGEEVTFNYNYGGAGPGIGAPLGTSSSTEDTYSDGDIYLSDSFSGPDLDKTDFTGLCLVEEGAAGIALGASLTVMLLGIPAKYMPVEIVKNFGALGIGFQIAVEHPGAVWAIGGPLAGLIFDRVRAPVARALQSDAKALLIIKGFNSGLQAGIGVSQGFGYIRMGAVKPPPPPGPKHFVIVQTPGKGLRLHLPNDVLFDFDKSTIKPQAERMLDEVAWTIAELYLDFRVSVEGHTDGIGCPKYNRALSLRRARAVWHWLVAHNVIKASDSTVKGWGMEKPLVPNRRPNGSGSDDPAARARNRRVEIFLTQ